MCIFICGGACADARMPACMRACVQGGAHAGVDVRGSTIR